MSKSVLACFYDLIGDCVVSYQIYPSLGDFYRSIIKASQDSSLPFSNFSSDYKVALVGELDNFDCLSFKYPFTATFAQIQEAGKGMDVSINFNTNLFLSKLDSILKGDSVSYVES